MILTLFTIFHVAISLIGLLAGYVAVFGLMAGRLLPRWTAIFLWMTVATSLVRERNLKPNCRLRAWYRVTS